MKIKILTLFKDMFIPFLETSIIKRAILNRLVEVEVIDLRQYSFDKHHHVDDTPYGGGKGMVIKVDIVKEAIDSNISSKTKVLLTSPRGKTYDQKKAIELSNEEEILIICGHYEGFDERVLNYVDEEISIGDYVLTGGELAAMVIADSIIRLQKNVLSEGSYEDDSFQTGLLEYPQFTRPYDFLGNKVPDVLVNGNHEEIRKYRLYESLKITYLRRPDLLLNYKFNDEEKKMLEKIKKETLQNN